MASIHKLIAGAAAVAALALAWAGMASAQATRLTATPDDAAVLTVSPPRTPAATYLEVWVKAYVPPRRGAAEAVVSLMPAHGGKAIEVGRFTVFPAAPFTAKDARQMRAYRFNAGAALRALAKTKELTVRVTLHAIGVNTAMSGAMLTIDRAEFSAPPS